MKQLRLRRSAVALTAVVMSVGLAAPTHASISQPDVVSETPSSRTPHAIDDGVVANAAVNAFSQAGPVMYAGGRFHSVQDPTRRSTLVRNNLFSFDVSTGVPTGWTPDVNGEVNAIQYIAPYLYVGGGFTAADGVSGQLVRYRVDGGTPVIDQGWQPARVSAKVTDLDYTGGQLLVAGSFRKKLTALDPDTGRDTGYINLEVSGSVKRNEAGPIQVLRIAVSPDGSRLVGIGNFTTIGTASRPRAFMLDLGAGSATVASWYYQPLVNPCAAASLAAQLRDVDFSPDGSYFVLAATGYIPRSGGVGRDICDAAARFETAIANPTRPTWINYTGGDTLHSVAATGAAVYVGGHQRWLDNPLGNNSAGPGAVPRQGIGAIDPTTGKALPWNPGKTRGVGTTVIYPTATGVWFGSDGRRFAGDVHDSIAFTPLP
ncbi:MAG: hypothetical protein K0Q93_924 [Nocardioidaceae bacterium]|nr:hypothetical protein [Nocardioidaceae bacterium]